MALTAERLSELIKAGVGWKNAESVDVVDFRDRQTDGLTWGELRALIATAQQAQADIETWNDMRNRLRDAEARVEAMADTAHTLAQRLNEQAHARMCETCNHLSTWTSVTDERYPHCAVWECVVPDRVVSCTAHAPREGK